MALGDIYKVTIVFNNVGTGKDNTTGIHVRQQGLAAPTINNMGVVVKEWWDSQNSPAPQKTHHTNDIALTKVTLQRISPLEPVVFEYTDGLPIVGTNGTANDNPQLSCLLSLRTGSAGRRYRGRCYLPPLGEGVDDESGKISAIEAGDIAEQFMTAIVSDIGGLQIDEDVVVWSAVGGHATAVTHVLCDRQQRTQRRRNVRTPDYVSS